MGLLMDKLGGKPPTIPPPTDFPPPEPRFFCPRCRDTGVKVRIDKAGLQHSDHCDGPCSTAPPLTPAQNREYSSIAWEIDGDFGKDRLRFRRPAKHTLWLYPNGDLIQYHLDHKPHFRTLATQAHDLYRRCFDEAKKARRQGAPELILKRY